MEKEVERRISYARGDGVKRFSTSHHHAFTSAHKTNINDKHNTT
jgi:hypothetical protein